MLLISTRLKEIVIIGLLLVLAFFVRLDRIDSIPPGMYGDEVTVGLNSLKIINSGKFYPFESSYSHPTPLLYLTGLTIKTFGHSIFAIRLPSIIFGSLSVVAFYFLLRLFFDVPFAIAGALLLTFSYPALVLSRLAYEPMPAIFFEILCLIFLNLFTKSPKPIYLFCLGLSLSAGLYTYLSFRLFFSGVVFLLIIFYYQNRKKLNPYSCWPLLTGILILGLPLFTHALIDPGGFWGRTRDISVFGYGLNKSEVFKEIWGALTRTLGMFGVVGDPNWGKNPGNAPIFDWLTTFFCVTGIINLFKKDKMVLFGLLVIAITGLFSDIFSLERIPEFHYYGLGHPNTLRINSFIPLVQFVAICGIWAFTKFLYEKLRFNPLFFLITSIVIIISVNYVSYFYSQNIFPDSYLYNYTVNQTAMTNLMTDLNLKKPQTVLLDEATFQNSRRLFFLDKKIKVSNFPSRISLDNALIMAKEQSVTAIILNQNNLQLATGLLKNSKEYGLKPEVRVNYLNQPEALLLRH